MKRPIVSPAALLALAIVVGAGCDTHRWSTRQDQDQSSSSDGARVIGGDAGDSPKSGAQGFFKNNRLSGGWSSQARDIEKDLGVGN